MGKTVAHTYCPRLWEEIFIDDNGSVFACCHKKPAKIGTIYKDPLKEICNNECMRNLRKASLGGKLSCFKNCTLLRKDLIVYRKRPLFVRYNDLKRLKILFGEACNIKCIMCWQNNRNKKVLSFGSVIKNVDISPFEEIEIQGGEPLFIEEAKQFFEYAILKNKKISFMTNGMLIDKNWAKKIALHSSFVCFSLNGATEKTHELINRGSNWKKVLRNIRLIKKMRGLYRTPLKLLGHMTIVPQNMGEIPLFVNKCKQLDFDLVDFGFDERIFTYMRNISSENLAILRCQIQSALNKSRSAHFAVAVHRLKYLGLL